MVVKERKGKERGGRYGSWMRGWVMASQALSATSVSEASDARTFRGMEQIATARCE